MNINKLVFLFFCLNVIFISGALPKSKDDKKKIKKTDTTTVTSVKNWSYAFSIEHYNQFKENSNTSTTFGIDINYKINTNNKLKFVDQVTKKYEINPGEDEVTLSDPSIYHYYTFDQKLFETLASLRSGFTLPISETSRQQERISVLSEQLQLTKTYFDKKLTLSYRPKLTYYYHRFKTTYGGRPLNKYGVSHSLLVIYNFTKELSLAGLLGHGIVKREESSYQVTNNYALGTYNFDIWGSYAFTEVLGGRIGYSFGNSQNKYDKDYLIIFDSDVSQYYFALDISF